MAQFGQAAVIKRIANLWGRRQCPMCGGASWQVSDPVQLKPPARSKAAKATTASLNVVPVECGHCGLVFLLNAESTR